MNVFDRLEAYGFIHHRALNDFTELENALGLARKYPQISHVLEGDTGLFNAGYCSGIEQPCAA